MTPSTKSELKFWLFWLAFYLLIAVGFMSCAVGCAEKFIESSPPVCGHWEKTTNNGYIWSDK